MTAIDPVRASFEEARATYTSDCSADRDLPWIEAWIVSANRDWDGIEGVINPEPVDTALTMTFALHAVDGEKIWSTTVTAKHRVVDPPPPPFARTIRSLRGSRDFGVVLRDALDQGYEALITSEIVRAAFDDTALTDPPSEPADETASE